MCYYFNDIINVNDLDFYNFFLDVKSYENIFIYFITYKTMHGVKPLPNMITLNIQHYF